MIARVLPALVLVACSIGWDEPSDVPQEPIFPHPTGYATAASHGADAHRTTLVPCLTCHVDGSVTAPACENCHASYPHRTGWLAGDVHGAGLAGDDADLSPCLACHGVSGTVAGDDVPCTTCHGSFPHPDGWATAGQHGRYALDRGDAAAVCGPCHGTDLAGGDVNVGCNDCHTVYPHPPGWSDPSAHGGAAGPSCFGCHGEGGTGGTSGVACAQCHSTYPHPDGWQKTHFTLADQLGETVCLECHDPGDGLPGMPALCAAGCHGGVP